MNSPDTPNTPAPTEKLQKLLAQAGICARREAERWINDGRVTVDGKPAHLGQRITIAAKVTVDGKPVNLQDSSTEAIQLILYHKPLGVICSRKDPQGRPTIFDNLPPLTTGRWITVGRLDINSSGLLLLTNSGELAHRLMHPSYDVARVYRVRIDGQASQEELAQLQQGVMLEDGLAKFDRVTLQRETDNRNSWYEVELHEGKNREVRRLWAALGYQVNRLIRVSYAGIELPRELRESEFMAAEVADLRRLSQGI